MSNKVSIPYVIDEELLKADHGVGGTASEIGGGKFENGATTGAFGAILNDGMHEDGYLRTRSVGPYVAPAGHKWEIRFSWDQLKKSFNELFSGTVIVGGTVSGGVGTGGSQDGAVAASFSPEKGMKVALVSTTGGGNYNDASAASGLFIGFSAGDDVQYLEGFAVEGGWSYSPVLFLSLGNQVSVPTQGGYPVDTFSLQLSTPKSPVTVETHVFGTHTWVDEL